MLLWINPRYQTALCAEGTDPYDSVARLRPADDLVEKQGRSTARYLIDVEGQQVGIYLKKYPRLPWWTRTWSAESEFPGPREWTRMLEVQELGIRTAEPIVAGADRKHACKSILATRELAGYQELHKFIPPRFAGPLTEEAWRLKQRLIARLADTARRLHEARMFHLDFYLCHFFIREDAREPDGFDLVLIDLLRLTRSRRSRWQVKDLAQFLFSSDLPGIDPEDRMQFFKLYCGSDRLSGADRRLLLRVQWKAWLYHRHNRSPELRPRREAA
jgi:hypothetical protein